MMKSKLSLSFILILFLFSQCKKEEGNDTPIEPSNIAPILVHINDVVIRAAESDTITISAVDGDGDLLTFKLVDNPGFLSILDVVQSDNTTTAQLRIAPGEDVLGSFLTNVLVEDQNGGKNTLSFNIKVEEVFTYTIDSNIIKEIAVNFINSSDYEVESSYFGRATFNGPSVYGIIKIRYLGDNDRNYLKMKAYFKDTEGNFLYEHETYLDQDEVAWGGNYNSNTFVTPEFNIGSFKYLLHLTSLQVELSDIGSIDVSITYNNFNYQPAEGHLKKEGLPYVKEIDSWYQDFQNDGSRQVEVSFCNYNLKDELNREFKWTYCDHYMWNEEDQEFNLVPRETIVSSGEHGYVQSISNTPDYYENDYLSVSQIFLDWRVPGNKNISSTEKEIVSKIKTALEFKTLSELEKNNLFLNGRNQIMQLRSQK